VREQGVMRLRRIERACWDVVATRAPPDDVRAEADPVVVCHGVDHLVVRGPVEVTCVALLAAIFRARGCPKRARYLQSAEM
jgi:hypothetical protein